MRFGLVHNTGVVGVDATHLTAVARHAEEVGFESSYVPEHIALYPGARVGQVAFPPDLAVADPLDCLPWSRRARPRSCWGTAVLLLPLHHPVPLVKRLATIERLSCGRMRLLTVGVGALPGEAAAVAVDYRTRGRRAAAARGSSRVAGCRQWSAP